jgi:hypothetical protein
LDVFGFFWIYAEPTKMLHTITRGAFRLILRQLSKIILNPSAEHLSNPAQKDGSLMATQPETAIF